VWSITSPVDSQCAVELSSQRRRGAVSVSDESDVRAPADVCSRRRIGGYVPRHRLKLAHAPECRRASDVPDFRSISEFGGLRLKTNCRRGVRVALSVAGIAPLVLASAAGGTARSVVSSASEMVQAVTANEIAQADTPSGPAVVSAAAPSLLRMRIAAPLNSTPPMTANVPGPLGIPAIALAAYRHAELEEARSNPSCGISWSLLAGIGHVESGHANGGATDGRGAATHPIYGPALDGTLPGNEVISQRGGTGQISYIRAIGPMQFLPATWARYAADGDGDGVSDPENLFDASLGAAHYLCSGGLNLRDQSQMTTAILRYNNSIAYSRNVLGWTEAYASGIAPADLPQVVGPAPLGDAHLEHSDGPGPNVGRRAQTGQSPLIDLGQSGESVPRPIGPAQSSASDCTLVCIESHKAPGPLSP
jgi:membrane-bound lytic murein transglycosylase B